jgi:hypothetical protein
MQSFSTKFLFYYMHFISSLQNYFKTLFECSAYILEGKEYTGVLVTALNIVVEWSEFLCFRYLWLS